MVKKKKKKKKVVDADIFPKAGAVYKMAKRKKYVTC